MPINVEGHGLVYTEAEVKEGFVPSAVVRADYVPKEGKDGFKDRLQAKDAQITNLTNRWLEAQPKLTGFEGLQARLAEYEQRDAQRRDTETYTQAGLKPAEDGSFDAGLIDLLRTRHGQVFSALDDAAKGDATADDHFRAWLTADDGLKADPYMSGHVKAQPAPCRSASHPSRAHRSRAPRAPRRTLPNRPASGPPKAWTPSLRRPHIRAWTVPNGVHGDPSAWSRQRSRAPLDPVNFST
jgi:hypothetical protein